VWKTTGRWSKQSVLTLIAGTYHSSYITDVYIMINDHSLTTATLVVSHSRCGCRKHLGMQCCHSSRQTRAIENTCAKERSLAFLVTEQHRSPNDQFQNVWLHMHDDFLKVGRMFAQTRMVHVSEKVCNSTSLITSMSVTLVTQSSNKEKTLVILQVTPHCLLQGIYRRLGSSRASSSSSLHIPLVFVRTYLKRLIFSLKSCPARTPHPPTLVVAAAIPHTQ